MKYNSLTNIDNFLSFDDISYPINFDKQCEQLFTNQLGYKLYRPLLRQMQVELTQIIIQELKLPIYYEVQ